MVKSARDFFLSWKRRRNYCRPLLLASMVLGLLASLALALEPPTREQLEAYRRDGTLAERIAAARAFGNHRVAPRLAERAAYRLRQLQAAADGNDPGDPGAMAPPPAWRGMPTTGTVKVLAVLINFTDYPPTSSSTFITNSLFGNGVALRFPLESLRNYYFRSSFGKLNIQGSVLGWYATTYPRSSVPQTDAGRDNLIREVLTYYDAQGHDFSQYDNDGDGVIDYFMVFWTGPAGAWASFWWGYQTSFSDPTFVLDGTILGNYSWQWETSGGGFDPSTVIHETGHALGVPDYYDYDDTVGPRGGVGGLDIMDGTGDHNCFSKFLLDWVQPVVCGQGTGTFALRQAETNPDALVIMPRAIPGDPFGEYFMVQYRKRTGNDKWYPRDGLLLWHVDARLDASGTNYVFDNSYTSHKLLRLMEADGLEEIEMGKPANAGDYYIAGSSFTPASIPNSSRYDGIPTGLSAGNITSSTDSMSLQASFESRPPAITHVGACVGTTECTITWDTSEYADSTILFGPSAPPAEIAAAAGLKLHHSMVLGGLQPGASYYFQIKSADLNLNLNTSKGFQFTTRTGTDSQSLLFTDNMEGAVPGWTSVPGGTAPWTVVATGYASSPGHAWFSADQEGVKNDLLLTPLIDLTGATAASLRFFHTYKHEQDYDGGVVQVTTDGGATFDNVDDWIESGGYTGIISPYTNSVIRGQMAWTGGELGTPGEVLVDLGPWVGYPVRIGFRLACDALAHETGWYVDDVSVSATLCQGGDATPVPPGSGDLNGDHVVNAADLVLLGQYLSDRLTGVPAGDGAADLDSDWRVNVVDQVLLQRKLVR